MKVSLKGKAFYYNLSIIGFISSIGIFVSCQGKLNYYSKDDFSIVPKTDVHLHINTLDSCYMELATKYKFRVISPNVDSKISVKEQLSTSNTLKKKWPGRFAFWGTFAVDSFGTDGFAENTIKWIEECMKEGACGIKIWKNIGMVLKDMEGHYVMVDHPAFEPVFRFLQEHHIPVMGHLGEPRNCWLPLNEMTDSANYRYYRENPKYHMYLHPEAPSYEDQIISMENLLKKFLALDYTGAHLASLEWNVDELAKRLDLYPNMKVDLSARMTHLQAQSIKDNGKVRNFMIKYQDRILYGTDITVNAAETRPDEKAQAILDRWISNWIYLTTDSTMAIKNLSAKVKGLQLPKEVIDKIYNINADRFFKPV